jgi:hydroxypyruvate reductase
MQNLRADIMQIFKSAIRSVRGDTAIKRHVQLSSGEIGIDSSRIALDKHSRIFVVGAGKASAYMAAGLEEQLDSRITGGLISVKYGHSLQLSSLKLIEAGHPTPDEKSLKAAQAIMRIARSSRAGDLVFCLLSGGASSLMCLPQESLTLTEKVETTERLLRCGADIHEVNTLRKHLSAVKGGRLTRAISPAHLITLAISDVIGDEMTAIGSGPTVADPTTFQNAWAILEKYDLFQVLPENIVEHLRAGVNDRVEETPKPDDSLFKDNIVCIVASNRQALQVAKDAASELRYMARVAGADIKGEARLVGRDLARKAKEIREGRWPVMLLTGGETTVKVTGHGKGGRNQELALSAAIELEGVGNVVLASVGTDGTDGPTDAAGAIVDGSTVTRGRQLGMDARAYLEDNNSYKYLDKIGDLIRTGPTGTNVMDLQVIAVTDPGDFSSVR